ncbi:CopD family protein [Streptomyces sp. NPDC051704]|uniref:CopD family protein n=1 Tax=Streptomyces sp. NPDC051704 TaxID=3365671 RepID=UPI0037BB5D6D
MEVTRRRAARHLAWAGVVLLVAGYLQLAARLARAGKGMPFGEALSPARIRDFLRAPAGKDAWVAQGTIHLVQNIVLLLVSAVLIALFLPRARRHLNAIALTALPSSLAVTLIAAVPATAPKNADKVLDLVFDQVHIVSGVVWIGGLAFLAGLAASRRGLGENAGLPWADIWRRFSLVALVCVGAVLTSGLWLGWKHVGSISQLWTTTYGLFVLVKILLVLGMVGRLGEVALGIAVLAVVPFLSGSARSEAGSPPAVSSGSIFAVGALLVVTLAGSLYVTVKTSDALARRATPTTA